MDAEAPLFLMYTSGTTGKPKGCQHRTGGYLAYVTGTSKYIQDIHPEDTYWCMADIGWITGHSYIVYGPLALAATSVIYEGVPTFPDAGRVWRIAERLDVNIFHTSPTAIRMLRKAGPDEPAKYQLPLQAHDDGGRADRARGLEVVLQRRRQERSGDRRHVVADGERWIPLQHEAGDRPDEARKRRTRSARNLPRHLRREEPGSEGGLRQSRQHLYQESLAGNHSDDLGRPGSIRAAVLLEILQGPEEQEVAGLAVFRRRRRRARRRRLLPHPRPRRRRDQRGGPSPRHEGARVRVPDRPSRSPKPPSFRSSTRSRAASRRSTSL